MLKVLINDQDEVSHYIVAREGSFGIFRCITPKKEYVQIEVIDKSTFLQNVAPIIHLINYNILHFGLMIDGVVGLYLLHDNSRLEYFKTTEMEAVNLYKKNNRLYTEGLETVSFSEADKLLKKINNIWKV